MPFRIQNGTSGDSRGWAGTALARLLTARFTVRIRAPEPQIVFGKCIPAATKDCLVSNPVSNPDHHDGRG